MILKQILLIIFTFLYIFYENWVPTPSCDVVSNPNNQETHHDVEEDDLKVMMVADLLLSGQRYGSGYLDLDQHFKDFYFSRFFKVC